jgi:hypothetical protein
MRRLVRHSAWAMLCLTLGAVPPMVRGADAGLDNELRQQLCLPAGAPLELVEIGRGTRPPLTAQQAASAAPGITKFAACHVGERRLLFAITFTEKPTFYNSALLFYVDFDCSPATGRQDAGGHRGVDMMVIVSKRQVGIDRFPGLCTTENTYVAGAKIVGNTLYLTLDGPLSIHAGKVRVDLQLSSELRGGRSDSTRRQVIALAACPARKVPAVSSKGTPNLRPWSDYRYHDRHVLLEKLADKGMTAADVTPVAPLRVPRPCPAAPFAAVGRHPGRAGSIRLERVPVELQEEAGVTRESAAVSFGFPLPQGGLFDLGQLRVRTAAGAERPAQFTATAFWPDGSLKWVLVDYTARVAAKELLRDTVELGSDVRGTPSPSPLLVDEAAERLTVVTGPLKVAIDKRRFQLFQSVWLDHNRDGRFDAQELVAASAPEGVRLVDEKGRAFTLSGRAPESVRIEQRGPQKVVVRVAGPYADAAGQCYMRYVARLVFRAGLPQVTVVFTHVNDYLNTEFTDITSLTLSLQPTGGIRTTRVPLDNSPARPGRRVALFQSDEAHCRLECDGRPTDGSQAPGVARCTTAHGTLGCVVHDFWQRWPKGLSADAQELRVELLPRQPNAAFGRGLPHYLFYPFVEGFYRFKWGMAFTERVTFDFGGATADEPLRAEAQRPLVAVLPAAWYARTNALGALAAPRGAQFALWDKYAESGCRNYLAVQAHDRTFGYLNYGDWYGERGRNWGNNEYDFAHGYFMQFARTGRREYFRLALAAARHQADVDIVHAYPDPYYVGANHQHSIGHTGMWSHVAAHGLWSHRYDSHTSAENGHTWAEGMMEAWWLTGEAPIVESALALGEHITWAMAPTFTHLGTHERSAGWSLKAIMAIYRGTYDPAYLEAARRIAAVALAEQKFDDGGAWPHLLPGDHAGGHVGARGNAIFLISVLLGGLKAYDEEVHNPAVERSIVSGAGWLLKCWNEEAEGWPYTASVSGTPYFPPGPWSNPLAGGVLAYAAHLSGDARFMRVAELGLLSLVRRGGAAEGKSIAAQMNFTASTLALMQQWFATRRPDHGLGLLAGGLDDQVAWLAKTRPAKEYSVRAPDRKRFVVRPTGAEAKLVATRRPHGAMIPRAEQGTIRVLDAAGAVIAQGRFSTSERHEFTCPLTGSTGARFQVLIDDDQRGVWNVAGPGLQIAAQTGPGFCIGGVGRSRYAFFVPQGTREFCVNLRAGHTGHFAGLVLSPTGAKAGFFQGKHEPPFDAAALKTYHGHEGSIVVRPAVQDTGKPWALVLTAAGDMYCELQGVAPYLSLSAKEVTAIATADPHSPSPGVVP